MSGPQAGLIPVRFHIYWAGASKDGAVVGFYWAVTETLATPVGPGLPIPELPGPKASDYHFTTRSDSTFTFTTSIDVPDRVHTFYVCAVDNHGKSDPTPARVYFRALDRYPPVSIFDQAQGIGTVYIASGGGVTPQVKAYDITDSAEVSRSVPRDTVPSSAQLVFRWHSEATLAGMNAKGYRYKLDEPTFNVADSSVHGATYNTHVGGDIIVPGVKTFMLQTIGPSGWASTSTKFFSMNFAPDEWFSGPDLSSPLWTTYTDGGGHQYWYRNVDWSTFGTSGGFANTLLTSDSARVLPASRPERRTFFEFYGNRIWGHVEGDTVNLNSWVVFPSGGNDLDSPYAVKVGTALNIPVGAVTTPGPPNGSPIGFRSQFTVRKMDNLLLVPTESNTYPVFDFASSFHAPHISYYGNATLTGEAFVTTVGEDGEGNVDRRVDLAGGAVKIVDDIDKHLIGPADNGYYRELYARPKVMHFYVNHAPYLKSSDGQFRPTAGLSYQRGTLVQFNFLADDIDPLDYGQSIAPGGPQPGIGPVLQRTWWITGTNDAGRDTSYVPTAPLSPTGSASLSFVLPSYFAPGAAVVHVTVCDYRANDAALGFIGRCSPELQIPITITGPVPADAQTGATQPADRPGSTPTDGRRQQP